MKRADERLLRTFASRSTISIEDAGGGQVSTHWKRSIFSENALQKCLQKQAALLLERFVN